MSWYYKAEFDVARETRKGRYTKTQGGVDVENGMKLTRRRMLQLTGVGMLGAGVTFAGAGCSNNAASSSGSSASDGSVTLSVYDPTGEVEITQEFAERLDGLDGKTIAFVGNGMWEEDRTFLLLQELMESKYSDITIITPDNFPRTSDLITVDDNGLPEMMEEMGVDGVIVGNAG